MNVHRPVRCLIILSNFITGVEVCRYVGMWRRFALWIRVFDIAFPTCNKPKWAYSWRLSSSAEVFYLLGLLNCTDISTFGSSAACWPAGGDIVVAACLLESLFLCAVFEGFPFRRAFNGIFNYTCASLSYILQSTSFNFGLAAKLPLPATVIWLGRQCSLALGFFFFFFGNIAQYSPRNKRMESLFPGPMYTC